jgi:hypothetical protein
VGIRSRAAPKSTIVGAEVESEMVLLDIEAGDYFGLDEVGTAIWRRLGQGASEDEIVSSLIIEYEVDPEQLRSDVRAFVRLLHAKGLVEIIDE